MEVGRGRLGDVCLLAVVRNSNCSPPCLRTGQKVISSLKNHGDNKAVVVNRLVI